MHHDPFQDGLIDPASDPLGMTSDPLGDPGWMGDHHIQHHDHDHDPGEFGDPAVPSGDSVDHDPLLDPSDSHHDHAPGPHSLYHPPDEPLGHHNAHFQGRDYDSETGGFNHLGGESAVDSESGSEGMVLENLKDCVPKVEADLLKGMGIQISAEEARELARSEGWLTENGTSPEDVGRVLESRGIEVDRGHDYSLTDLTDAIDKGHKVLVGLDGEEIWHPEEGPGRAPLELPDVPHVVHVSGYKFDNSGRMFLEIKDPAAPERGDYRVDADDFLNAWTDFGNFAVITRQSFPK